jgi:hypothetical protein
MKAFVLTTIINGRKNYVANLMSVRGDNKKIVNYTIDTAYAKDFGSEAAAAEFVDHIVNPHERQYTPDVIEVTEAQLQPVRELAEEDIK